MHCFFTSATQGIVNIRTSAVWLRTSTSQGALVRKNQYCPIFRFDPCIITQGQNIIAVKYLDQEYR